MKNAKTLQLDFIKPYMEPINIELCDFESYIFDIHMSVGGFPVNVEDAKVIFYARGAGKKVVFNPCVAVDNAKGHVQYDIKNLVDVDADSLCCWILIIKDDKELRSMKFTVTITPADN